MPTKLCGLPVPRCQSVLPDSAHPTIDNDDTDTETPDHCLNSDFDDSQSKVDVFSETDDECD